MLPLGRHLKLIMCRSLDRCTSTTELSDVLQLPLKQDPNRVHVYVDTCCIRIHGAANQKKQLSHDKEAQDLLRAKDIHGMHMRGHGGR